MTAMTGTTMTTTGTAMTMMMATMTESGMTTINAEKFSPRPGLETGRRILPVSAEEEEKSFSQAPVFRQRLRNLKAEHTNQTPFSRR